MKIITLKSFRWSRYPSSIIRIFHISAHIEDNLCRHCSCFMRIDVGIYIYGVTLLVNLNFLRWVVRKIKQLNFKRMKKSDFILLLQGLKGRVDALAGTVGGGISADVVNAANSIGDSITALEQAAAGQPAPANTTNAAAPQQRAAVAPAVNSAIL